MQCFYMASIGLQIIFLHSMTGLSNNVSQIQQIVKAGQTVTLLLEKQIRKAPYSKEISKIKIKQ